jgi:predicted acetyltransferase
VPHDVHPLCPDELRTSHTLFAATVHRGPFDDEQWSRIAPAYHPGRTFGAKDGNELVGTAMSVPCRTVVPGGAVLPMAAVTRVGVRADRTRRGVLTALMRAQLRDVAARGETFASLRASEAGIYGRFGYGPATRGRDVRVRTDRRRWRAGAPQGGAVRLLGREEIVPVLREVHAAIALRRPGAITRWDEWWWGALGRRVQEREHVLAAVHTGATGDDGFAVAVLPDSAAPVDGRSLTVSDLQTANLDAAVGLWRFLLDIDLVASVEGPLRPLDEPLELLLTDPRACAVTGVHDETWLRIVDVPTALATRSYGAADPVLLAVHDTVCTGNAGVYRIADGAAERVGPLGGPPVPELECDVAALAMAYLGDRAPSRLAATGWWTAHSPDAAGRADAAFATSIAPWSGTWF